LRFVSQQKYGSITTGEDYEEAIYCAVRGGHEDAVWLLIDTGMQLSELVHVKSMVMIEGAKAGRVEPVKMMLRPHCAACE